MKDHSEVHELFLTQQLDSMAIVSMTFHSDYSQYLIQRPALHGRLVIL